MRVPLQNKGPCFRQGIKNEKKISNFLVTIWKIKTHIALNLPPPSLEGFGDAILALFAAGGPSTFSSWSAMMSQIKSQRPKTFNRLCSKYYQVYSRSRMKIFYFCKNINPIGCNVCHATVFYPHMYSLEFRFRLPW